MGDIVKAYYDQNGVLCKRVIVVNEPNWDHTKADNLPGEETWVGVVIDKAVYDAFPPALNIDGIAVHHHMNKWVGAQIAQRNPTLSTKMIANADALDVRIAADKKNAADIQAASLDAWNKLSPADQQSLIAADALAVDGFAVDADVAPAP